MPKPGWYPPVLAATWVLAAFLAAGVHPLAAVRSLLIAIVAAVALYLLLRIRMPHHRASAMSAAVVVVLISRPILAWVPGWPGIGPVLIAAAIIFVAYLTRHWHTPLTGARLTRRLNLFAGVFLAIVLGSSLINGALLHAVASFAPLPDRSDLPDPSPRPPDIYVLLLDGYARADTLEEFYAYDNSPFLSALARHGFDVAAGSHSNYTQTALTLTSLLYMQHVMEVPALRAALESEKGQGALVAEIPSSPGLDLLHHHGYELIALSPGYEQTALRGIADSFRDSGSLNEFEILLMRISMIGDLVQILAPDFPSAQQRERVRFNLDELVAIAATDAAHPRFVIGHVPSPHTPIVFGPNGEPIHATALNDFYEDRTATAEQYRGQVNYLNELVLDAVAGILAHAATPPVIVIMSDHGAGEFMSNAANPDPEIVKKRLRNLFVTFTPEHPGLFGKGPTPVNLLATLFNAYLDEHLPMAEDSLFMSLEGGGLAEVTDP